MPLEWDFRKWPDRRAFSYTLSDCFQHRLADFSDH